MRTLTALLCALLLAGCNHAFFYPDRILLDTPDRYGIDYEPVEISAEDGTQLFAWFLPARGAARGTVLYLHGNAQNISAHLPSIAWMPGAGFNVLALDYRGYGRSGGTPSIAGAQQDIGAAMRVLLARPDVDPGSIFVFGQSLGGALAIHYVAHSALRAHVRAVIVDSPFSDYRLISKEKLAAIPITWPLQWLPALTVDNDYSPQAAVHAVSPIPLLLIHGERDGLVPLHHSQRLFERAGEPKDLWVVPDAGHIQSLKQASVRSRLTDFLQRHSAERLAAAPR
jgi:fermentation-respiration switch protein FrsA (DUF1100 family)